MFPPPHAVREASPAKKYLCRRPVAHRGHDADSGIR
jgi:hypothetical protein